jgi:hypothetical protein
MVPGFAQEDPALMTKYSYKPVYLSGASSPLDRLSYLQDRLCKGITWLSQLRYRRTCNFSYTNKRFKAPRPGHWTNRFKPQLVFDNIYFTSFKSKRQTVHFGRKPAGLGHLGGVTARQLRQYARALERVSPIVKAM